MQAIDPIQARWAQPAGVRLVAAVVLACLFGGTAWALHVSGPRGAQIVLFTGPLAAAAAAAFRQRVTVDASEIVICNGVITRHVPWGEVVRLQWCSARQAGWPKAVAHHPSAGSLYLIRASGRPVAVPQTSVSDIERPRGSSAAMASWFSKVTSLPIVPGVIDEPDERDWG